ncbi:MAG: leucine-rich repeat protein [Lachnospiraceae bacterium]|nr:leucine-rich repeat protein [Lachnospiraceae bacterium]
MAKKGKAASKKAVNDKNKKMKLNPKLGKQIRLTLASVFLISAVVIALIPPGDIDASEKWENVQDDNRGNAQYPVVNSSSPGWVPSEPFLAMPDFSDPTAYETSFTLYEIAGQAIPWVYIDQFYYSVHPSSSIPGAGTSGNLAIINGYSDLLPASEIKLDNYLTRDYFTVSERKFIEFYAGSSYTGGDGSVVDNITWPLGGPGSVTFVYSYADYFNIEVNHGSLTDAVRFIENEARNDTEISRRYTGFKDDCKKYYDYIHTTLPQFAADWNAFVTAYVAWNNGPPEDEPRRPALTIVTQPGGDNSSFSFPAFPAPVTLGVPPTGIAADYFTYTIPADYHLHVGNHLSVSPSELSPARRLKYYCEWAERLQPNDPNYHHYLPGLNFTLVAANNQVGGGYIYIPRGGDLIGAPGTSIDNNGFLVIRRSEMVIGIGDDAFRSIGNVDYLDMPSEIKFIGDNAFSNSFIRSVNLTNVEKIGNQAFKNCTQLSTVTLRDGARVVGAEAFFGSGITELSLPYSLSVIGTGAFAECHVLQTVDMSRMNQDPTVIGDYAFYDCAQLREVKFSEIRNSFDIGEGAFALKTAAEGVLTTMTLPRNITGVKGRALGNYLFAGRMGLKSVIMPESYGTDRLNGTIFIPSGMFLMCTGLEFVEFPNASGSGRNGGFASYQNSPVTNANYPDDILPYRGQYLFLDVTNPNFYVRGPELSMDGQIALIRRSTWAAFTQISDFIPYRYINSRGEQCYEVSDGEYILQANVDGRLTGCQLVDDVDWNGSNPIDLIIPEYVGDIKINDIASDALANRNLRSRLRSLTISNNTLTSIAPNAFAGLPRLSRVVIGNSVKEVGANAFANCPLLTDITFNSPNGFAHADFVMGEGAFKTNSRSLTLNGDIVPGYAPFDYAMDPVEGNIAYDDNGRPTGLRILYKSLSPSLLTVMYDRDEEEVVLLNYPKFDRLDANNAGYLRSMEQFYTRIYSGSDYDDMRDDFVAEFKAGAIDYDDVLFGPWVSRAYLNLADAMGVDVSGINAYFEQKPYSIIDNFNNSTPKPWEILTQTENEMVNATLNIFIPAGVTSIDAAKYFNNNGNRANFSVYFDPARNPNSHIDMAEWDMIMGNSPYPNNIDPGGYRIVGGLFSGYYQDFAPDHVSEQHIRGNDQVRTITMSTVKYLPPFAFDSCENLTHVTLGDDLLDIGLTPFRGCTFLRTVTGNDKYLVDQGIIYSKKADDTYLIEQAFPARGSLVGNSFITSDTDPLIVNVSEIVPGAFESCYALNRVDLSSAKKLRIIPANCFNDCNRQLRTVHLPESVNRIETGAFGLNTNLNVYIPGYEVHIATDAFTLLPKLKPGDDPNTQTTSHVIWTYNNTSAHEYAVYHGETREMGISYILMNDRYMVDFLDHEGIPLIPTQRVEHGNEAIPPSEEVMAEYEERLAEANRVFVGWNRLFNAIRENTTVVALTKNMEDAENRFTVTFYTHDGAAVISEQRIALNESAVEPRPPDRSGFRFTGWAPREEWKNVTKDLSVIAIYATDPGSSGSPHPSGSPSGSPSPGSDTEGRFTVSVSGGSGSGLYAPGAIVTIAAYAGVDSRVFDRWTTASTGVGFQNASSAVTSFTMPGNNVTVTATYKNALSSSSGGGSASTNESSGSGGGSGTDGSGGSHSSRTNARVEITKPGIPNHELASASVSGSLDDFVIKITENQAATDAAESALKRHFGDITNIRYFPMDISLYDSTGLHKITDTTGLSINITMPLPTSQVPYGGNNRIASAKGGVLEHLNPTFTTIDGVPCIRFTTTHFSPYVIYADLDNLHIGILDDTPKTGDGVHPKWFLVIGLISVSLILFLRKEKVPELKTT